MQMKKSSLIYKTLLSLFLLAGALFCPIESQADEREASQQFSAVSSLLEQADNALEDNALADAIRLYGATVRAYQQFSKDYPFFAPDLVRFRIAYCQNQMQDIEKRQNQPTSPQSNLQASTNPSATRPQKIALSQDTLDALRNNDIAALQNTYEVLQKEGHPAAKLVQAILLVQKGNFKDARETLEEILRQYPNDPAAHYNMAQIILRADEPDFDLAREHYQKAIENGAPRDEDLEIVINL
jgi:tetratricopeptide (TPR) repeat protein